MMKLKKKINILKSLLIIHNKLAITMASNDKEAFTVR